MDNSLQDLILYCTDSYYRDGDTAPKSKIILDKEETFRGLQAWLPESGGGVYYPAPFKIR